MPATEAFLKKTAATYWKCSLWILCALSLATVLILRSVGQLESVSSLVIAVMFNLLAAAVYGQAWLTTARKAPQTLPKFYLAASALRLFAAAAVMLVYCFVQRAHAPLIKTFAFIFLAFYLAMLVFDTLYFARKGKSLFQNPNQREESVTSPND